MTWTMLDTFSGIGGFSLAARWTQRIETVQFIEIDPFCRRVLATHWPGVPIHDDIRTFLANADRRRCTGAISDESGAASEWSSGHGEARGLDLITGGFPCQPWSAAGKQQGTADDRDLWPELHRLVVSLRPRWGLFENVPGIIGMAGGLDRVLADLGESGYATGTVVVPAAAVGAYHRRDRVWIVAALDDASVIPSVQRRSGAGIGPEECVGRGERAHVQHGVKSLGTGDIEDVAHAADGGLRRGGASGKPGLAAQRGQDEDEGRAIHNALRGRHGSEEEGVLTGRNGAVSAREPNGHETLGGVGDAAHGLPRRMVGSGPIRFGPDWEAGIPRVTAHEEDRVNKLKALGNAIVPRVAYELLMMLLAVDDDEDRRTV